MRVFGLMRYRWWFFGELLAILIFAIVTVFVVGLDLGIDFRGGVRTQFSLEEAATVDDIRSLVSDLGVQDPVVQSVGGTDETSSFMITAEEMSEEQKSQLQTKLDESFGMVSESWGDEVVGASFGKETTNRAFIAIAIAVVAIVGYLSLRFAFKFAIPAIIALIHDVGLTLGIYVATNRLVTAATVAAILTILGYSVHDTIIIFDRMRENTLSMKRETYGQMVDLSIRQTMVRSINTTVALLLPLLAILLFGGPTLKDFAFALTIGVVSGTYSSFFVAAPLATIWKEREPRYRKRLAAAGGGGGPQVVVGAGSGQADGGSVDKAPSEAQRPTAGRTPARPGGARSSRKRKKGGSAKKKAGGKQRGRTSR